MKLHDALALHLRTAGTRALFGLMGDGNLFFVDSFIRTDGARYISVAHEATAVLAALGYARVTGEVGVATVTHGPALTNTVTALVEGARARLPIVLIAGDTAHADEFNLQNIPQRSIAAAAEAPFVELRAQNWEEDVRRAFRIARTRSRPVVLDVAVAVMSADVADPDGERVELSRSAPGAPREENLDLALGAIASARRPIVLAGRGAVEARAELVRLADLLGAALATSIGAKDLFAGEPGDIGVFGGLSTDRGVEAITASDCVVSFGASLNAFTTAHDELLAGKTVIVCDADPDRARSDLPGGILVGGDAAQVAATMADWIEEAGIERSSFREALRPAQATGPLGRADGLDIVDAYRVMDELLPTEHVLVTDGGRFLPLAWKALHVEHPRKLVPTIHFGSIGLGMGYAIGAAVGVDGSAVTLVTGDGGYMLGGFTELTTAIRHDLDLTVLVMNDGGYGAEWVQFEARAMDPRPSLMDWPDFAAVAEAAGAQGRTASSIDELRAALGEPRRGGPRLVDVRLDPASVPNELH